MKNTRPKLSIVLLALALLFPALLSSSAQADIIRYSTEGSFVLDSGTDLAGMDGADFLVEALFNLDTTYIDRFSYPAITALSSRITISGSSISGNNGVYAISDDVAFYPSYAGIYEDPSGLTLITLWLPGSGLLMNFGIETAPTNTGGSAMIGDTPMISDFGPSSITSPDFDTQFVISDGSNYDVVNSMANASSAPEPGSGIVLGLFSIMLLRRRRSARPAA